MKLNKEQLKELRDCTWYNDHNQARLVLAQHIKHTGLIKAYKAVKELHLFYGHMPHSLSLFSLDLDEILFSAAAQKITNFKKAYKCF